MQLVSETVQLPQESKAIKDALVAVVAGLKAGKSLASLAIAELPALEQAALGYSALPEEVKSTQEEVLAGLMVGQVLQALRGGQMDA